ncbi:hypothetical protein [Salinarimonas ramus]|uniref:Uncharacterized protein n=1 Tax=Salinarimonas ramus TaxID=690164 RepID=A0A917V527_9HYPH|nr:hypothetical protein [Salinarimonas ramus]GGK37870.1 hypothetical protein GCM10011322_26150 [Salinarimonas ramus]
MRLSLIRFDRPCRRRRAEPDYEAIRARRIRALAALLEEIKSPVASPGVVGAGAAGTRSGTTP